MNKQNKSPSFSIPVNLSISDEDARTLRSLIDQAQSIFDEINNILDEDIVAAQIMNDKDNNANESAETIMIR